MIKACELLAMTSLQSLFRSHASQRGVSLIVVLLILVIVSILGAGGAQIAMMAERGSRNDRDMQVAWQAAESALMDAEIDIHGDSITNAKPTLTENNRRYIFENMSDDNAFVEGCGASAGAPADKGLCRWTEGITPVWLSVDFAAVGNSAKTVEFGEITKRVYATTISGTAVGVQPVKAPRYIIEAIEDKSVRDLGTSSKPLPTFFYRITAMGFGPRPDIRAVSQIIYRD